MQRSRHDPHQSSRPVQNIFFQQPATHKQLSNHASSDRWNWSRLINHEAKALPWRRSKQSNALAVHVHASNSPFIFYLPTSANRGIVKVFSNWKTVQPTFRSQVQALFCSIIFFFNSPSQAFSGWSEKWSASARLKGPPALWSLNLTFSHELFPASPVAGWLARPWHDVDEI